MRMVISGCLLLAVTGCSVAGDTPALGPTSTTPMSTTPVSSSSSSPSSASSSSPSSPSSFTEDLTVTSPAGRGRVITVAGTVVEGVGARCLLLGEGEGLWLLVGHTAGLAAGDTVTLRGTAVNGMATTCQQGRPLWVDEVLER